MMEPDNRDPDYNNDLNVSGDPSGRLRAQSAHQRSGQEGLAHLCVYVGPPQQQGRGEMRWEVLVLDRYGRLTCIFCGS